MVFLAVCAAAFYYLFLYKAPSCFDGKQNGDEIGVDCGGSCPNLCVIETLPPVVLWSKIFNVSGNLYNAMAYVENPNINSYNAKADYEFKIYDPDNKLISTRTGSVSIPKNKKIGIFEPGFVLNDSRPKRVDFKFTGLKQWTKDISEDPSITVKYSPLKNATSSPRIDGTITNNSVRDINSVELTVFIIDGNENAVAASRTFVDSLSAGSSQNIVFTWPKPFDLGVEPCVNNIDVALALDMSGSMRSDSQNPPEPWTTVKTTAEDFVRNLVSGDQVAIVTFGTEATTSGFLTQDKDQAAQVVERLSLATTSENTNLGGGLSVAKNELLSHRSVSGNNKALIVLTDGIPNEPKMKGFVDYPKDFALSESRDIISSGIKIYAVGLGSKVDSAFLENLSGGQSFYYSAPTKETLSDVYKKISSAMCVRKPNVVIVDYRIVN